MNKSDIVAILEDIAVLLELKGENPFKIRAYSAGARVLDTLEEDLGDVIAEGRLGSIKGLARRWWIRLKRCIRAGVGLLYGAAGLCGTCGLDRDAAQIPCLAGKKVKKIHDALGVESIAALKAACESGEVAALKGFGAKSAEKILSGIENRAAHAQRHLWWDARVVAEPILVGSRALFRSNEPKLRGVCAV